MKQLYSAQRIAAIQLLSATRAYLVGETGTGKTGVTISALRDFSATSVLVICPAIARGHWAAEFDAWWSDHPDVGVVQYGPERKLSKKQTLLREQSYGAPIIVTSFMLATKLIRQFDIVVIDEAHALGDPTSQQSLAAQKFCKNAERVWMLSATPIPTVPKQIWFPLYLLEGGKKWGYPSKTGEVSWHMQKYLEAPMTEYGMALGKFKPGGEAALLRDMQSVTVRLSLKDMLGEMPPIRTSLLEAKKLDSALWKDWLESCKDDTHVMILCHHHALAEQIEATARKVRNDVISLRNLEPTKRIERLNACSQLPSCTVIMTYDSIQTSVRALWPQRVLFTEISGSPKTTGQVLGRFAAVGDTRRPLVELAITPKEETAAARLVERINSVHAVFGAAHQSSAALEALGNPLERIQKSMANIFDDFVETPCGWESDDDE
jgi:hypothetical protein